MSQNVYIKELKLYMLFWALNITYDLSKSSECIHVIVCTWNTFFCIRLLISFDLGLNIKINHFRSLKCTLGVNTCKENKIVNSPVYKITLLCVCAVYSLVGLYSTVQYGTVLLRRGSCRNWLQVKYSNLYKTINQPCLKGKFTKCLSCVICGVQPTSI